MHKLTKSAYQELIDEDIGWLQQFPDSLEHQHIEIVLKDSVHQHYPPKMESDRFTGEIHCPECGFVTEQDHNSYQCHNCKKLWPKADISMFSPELQKRIKENWRLGADVQKKNDNIKLGIGTEEQYERVCLAAIACLDDLRENRNVDRGLFSSGRLSLEEYTPINNRYKRLRDALWHAGYKKEVEAHKENE